MLGIARLLYLNSKINTGGGLASKGMVLRAIGVLHVLLQHTFATFRV